MSQIARNLTDAVDGFFAGKRYLIHESDPLYTKDFLATLAGCGIESVKLPPRSPNLNAYAEGECRLNRLMCKALPGRDDVTPRCLADAVYLLPHVDLVCHHGGRPESCDPP
jgi:hypothetical protein